MNPAPNLIDESEAIELYGINDLEPINYFGYGHIIFFKGNVSVDGHMGFEWLDQTLTLLKLKRTQSTLVIIDGDLSVFGCVQLASDPSLSLMVTGNLKSDGIIGDYNQNILIQGNAEIVGALVAIRQDAAIVVNGNTDVPFVLENGDHFYKINTPKWTQYLTYTEPNDLRSTFEDLKIEFDEADEEPYFKLIDLLVSGEIEINKD